ncbi:SLC13 family permease [Nocardioides sp. R-C-SC26]|uniref:SLC13 family permease n=1 Tax=Nocardioides sp. R-C-SC26 TaxID=2870414 RepID=UPI001E2949C8|nr:ArsB/NhaD family transporter [Nocardioides sp. R-C-SC26]
MIAAASVGIFLTAYAFIATEKISRIAAALGGVAAMTVLGVIDVESAFFSLHTGIDWNVIFLLFGMMVIVSVLKQTGLFECLALWAAAASRGDAKRLFVLIALITAPLGALLDSVTIVLLIAPVTMAACRRIGVSSMPYLLVVVFAANIGGTATLIGDPPNIMIGSRADLSFTDFLVHTAPAAVLILAVVIPLCRLLFRRQLVATRPAAAVAGSPRDAIKDPRRLAIGLVVLAAVMIGFGLHAALHLDPAVVAMLGAGAMVVLTGTSSEEFLEEVEWETLVFFMALFVLVGGLVNVGVVGKLGEFAVDSVGDQQLLVVTLLIFGSAVIGGLVDTIPYTAAMLPIVEQLVASTSQTGADNPLWWAFALGADLSGNTTAVAAGANVVVLGLAYKAGEPISFWQFTKYGLVVTLVSLIIAWTYVWLRYFALA